MEKGRYDTERREHLLGHMNSAFTESVVEQAALAWPESVGCYARASLVLRAARS